MNLEDRRIALACIAALLLCAGACWGQSREEAAYVVRVGTERGVGSGFVVGYAGDGRAVIVTAQHCVDDDSEVLVIDYADRQTPATLLRQDESADIAIVLSRLREPLPQVSIASKDARNGDQCRVLGYPSGWWSVRETEVIGGMHLSSTSDGAGAWNTSFRWNFVTGGHSGGPIVNSAGEVVALVRGSGVDSLHRAEDTHGPCAEFIYEFVYGEKP